MVTSTQDKPQAVETKASEPTGFGAYGAGANPGKDLAMALDPQPQSKTDGSLDFTDADKRWLKELGITTTDPLSHHAEWRSDREKYNHEHHKWNEHVGGRLAMLGNQNGVPLLLQSGDYRGGVPF